MKKWNQIFEWSKRARAFLNEEESVPSVGEEDPVVRRVVGRLSEPGYLQKKGKEQERFDAEAAFRKLHWRNTRRMIVRVGSVAAVIALVVGSVVIYKGDFSRNENVPVVAAQESFTLQPGKSKAVLHLADGRMIVLNDSLRGKVEAGEAVVEVDSAGLAYKVETDSLTREKKQGYHVIRIPRGGEYHLKLADGTQVWLNSETELRFPVHFSEGDRKVYLKGEAYFDVVKDAARPFVVNTSAGDIKVLGTAFNVAVYDTKVLTATLERGSISYERDSRQGVLIKPGEQLVYDEGTKKLVIRKVNTRLYTGWKENLFCFEEQQLDQIMATLARWYDFQVKFESEDLKELELSGTLEKYSDIQPLLRLFELGTNVKFEIQDQIIYVRKVK